MRAREKIEPLLDFWSTYACQDLYPEHILTANNNKQAPLYFVDMKTERNSFRLEIGLNFRAVTPENIVGGASTILLGSTA